MHTKNGNGLFFTLEKLEFGGVENPHTTFDGSRLLVNNEELSICK